LKILHVSTGQELEKAINSALIHFRSGTIIFNPFYQTIYKMPQKNIFLVPAGELAILEVIEQLKHCKPMAMLAFKSFFSKTKKARIKGFLFAEFSLVDFTVDVAGALKDEAKDFLKKHEH
jgi:DNA topoisomerase VI subunit B